jgi:hypothetical protein
MASIFNYFKTLAVTSTKRPDSPISDALPPTPGERPQWIDCGNMACIESVQDATGWKLASFNKSDIHFCSEECWDEWLNTPSHLGCYSPPPLSKND